MEGLIVTGAAGQVGAALVRHLRAAGRHVLAIDIDEASLKGGLGCDLRSAEHVRRLFDDHRFQVVVHLAAILPSAFRADPLAGADVNVTATLRLLDACIRSGVRRFVFGSSTSVYGSSARCCSEAAPPSPDDPYGAAKLAVERILEVVPSIETVSLRIPRVLGPGARNTGSPWRSQIFERADVTIPHPPRATLSVIHVDDLARVLTILVDAETLPVRTYNSPVESLRAAELARLIEDLTGRHVRLGTAPTGPQIDGTRFTRDFGLVLRPLREYLLRESAVER